MEFLSDRELFADLDENGQFTKKAQSDDTSGSRYQGGIRTGVKNVGHDEGSIYGKKDWKDDNAKWLFGVWEWGDIWIERFLSGKAKGISVGAFPPAVVSTGIVSQYTRISAYNPEEVVLKTAELEVDYFDNLSKCVDRLEGDNSDAFDDSLRGYFKDIVQSRKALSELTDNYISMKKVTRWIVFALLWTLLCISPTIPGMPSFMSDVGAAAVGRFGPTIACVIFLAPIVLQIIVTFFRCAGTADDFSILFWLIFPVVPIAAGLCGAVSVLSVLQELKEDYEILVWVLGGIYLFWLVILLLVVLCVRHAEGKKRKVQPELRKAFVDAVDANAQKIHRYIRFRVLWWKHLYGSKSLPYSLTHLKELLDRYVKEADRYRNKNK